MLCNHVFAVSSLYTKCNVFVIDTEEGEYETENTLESYSDFSVSYIESMSK